MAPQPRSQHFRRVEQSRVVKAHAEQLMQFFILPAALDIQDPPAFACVRSPGWTALVIQGFGQREVSVDQLAERGAPVDTGPVGGADVESVPRPVVIAVAERDLLL
jgi:hypothetical protein